MSGVVTLIKDDHKKLEAVFKKLEAAEPGDFPSLLQQVAALLIPHSKAEERVVYPDTRPPNDDSNLHKASHLVTALGNLPRMSQSK